MEFTRTNAGISNQHLFYNVDLVVYTEGGSNAFKVEEIENGKCNEQAPDIRFWSNIFLRLNRRIKIKAIGSKQTCLFYCEKIIRKEIARVAVAIDRDIDDRIGNLLDSPYILYTKGYSWENDVFTKELTCEQIASLLFMDNLSGEMVSIIDDSYRKFKRIGKNLAKIEILFRVNGIRFISAVNSERFLDSKKSPLLDIDEIFVFLKKTKKNIKKPINSQCCLKQIDPFLNNYGKLIQTISITLIRYICQNHGKLKTIPNDIIDCINVR